MKGSLINLSKENVALDPYVQSLTMEKIEEKSKHTFTIDDKYSVNNDIYKLYSHNPHSIDINKKLIKEIIQSYLSEDDIKIISSTLRCLTLVFQNSSSSNCPFTNSEVLEIINQFTSQEFLQGKPILHEAIRLAAVCTKNKKFVQDMNEYACINLFRDLALKINNDSMISLSLNAISNIIYYKDVTEDTITSLLNGTNDILKKVYLDNKYYYPDALFSLLHLTKMIIDQYNPALELSQHKVIQFLPNFFGLDSEIVIKASISLCETLYRMDLDIDSDSIVLICRLFIRGKSKYRAASIRAISAYFHHFPDCLFNLDQIPYSDEGSIFDFLYRNVLQIISEGPFSLSSYAISILYSILESDVSILEKNGDLIVTSLQNVLLGVDKYQTLLYGLVIIKELCLKNGELIDLLQKELIDNISDLENDEACQIVELLLYEMERNCN